MKSDWINDSNIPFDYENHWNNTYLKNPVYSLGWYEKKANPSLELIERCQLDKEALLFNPGAGATTLIEDLLDLGYKNLVVNDISSIALAELRNNLSVHKNAQVKFIVDDLTNPTELQKLKNVALWHDRAVLHFFTSEEQQNAYFNLLKKVVMPNGFVILAQFNTDGAKKCSGLNVVNYNQKMLQNKLGNEFIVIEAFNYTYFQPSGNTREFIYTLFQRKA